MENKVNNKTTGDELVNFLQQKIRTLQKRVVSPKTDLLENDTHYIVRMETLVKTFRWKILEDNVLLVTITKEMDTYDSDTKEIYRETKYGEVKRRVKLPGNVNKSAYTEKWIDGVWTIFIEKANS